LQVKYPTGKPTVMPPNREDPKSNRTLADRIKSCLIVLGIVLLLFILLAFLIIPLLTRHGEPVDVEFHKEKHVWESPD
jgi:hypothetical protein